MRATFVAVLGLLLFAPAAMAVDEINTKKFRDNVTVNGIMSHQRSLQAIANANGGTRASGTPGYDASAAYVKNRLKKAGYKVTQQEFDFPFFEELAPAELSQVVADPDGLRDGDVRLLRQRRRHRHAGPDQRPRDPGDALAELDVRLRAERLPGGPAPARGGAGPARQLRLRRQGEQRAGRRLRRGDHLQRGQPRPYRAVHRHARAGPTVTIPVVGLSYADAVDLYEATQAGTGDDAGRHVDQRRRPARRPTSSRTPSRATRRRSLVVGAHLDSVLAGPGINDNGSGTSTILEIAEEMSEAGTKPRQKVRFAFWGAEESNLLGSTALRRRPRSRGRSETSGRT